MLSRRSFAMGLATGLAATGAVTAAGAQELALAVAPPLPLDPLAPQVVPVAFGLAAGEIHVDPNRFALYLTLADATAIRYAVGIGRPGLYEPGAYVVGAKKEWPSWTPTPDMVAREPERYAQYAEEGMPGGPGNPLGARALYLFQEGRGDTFLRIHGTDAPETIGTAVSNGCARLLNDHVVDLYDRVAEGAPVYLHPNAGPVPA